MRTQSCLTILVFLSTALSAQQQQLSPVRIEAADCGQADSLLGPVSGKRPTLEGALGIGGEIRLGYPHTAGQWVYGTINPRLEMAAHPAPLTTAPLPAELLMTLSGEPARKLLAAGQPLPATLSLKEDTTYDILGTFPTVTGSPAASMAIAFVSFPLGGAQLGRLAGAKDAKVEFLGQKIPLRKDLRRAGAESYRAVLCGYVRTE